MVSQEVIDRVKKFLSCYSPAEKLDDVDNSMFEKYGEILPHELLVLWSNFGFGNYGGGVLKLIDPDLFKKNLNTWLRGDNPNCYPFMITAFGDMYYLRMLPDGSEEVRLISIIYHKEKLCSKSFVDFFSNYILSSDTINNDLKASLYLKAEEVIGKLSNDDIYTFVPSVYFGGNETVESIQIADAYIYQDIAYGD